jgi:hypothetical protein
MLLAILAAALVMYVLADGATHGRVHAVTKGTTKGVAKQTGRATVTGARRARDNHRAYLKSGKAPLGRTRLAAGNVSRGALRAVATGARDGVKSELVALRKATAEARKAAEAARRAAQDPALGARPGAFGKTFDKPPKHRADKREPRDAREAFNPRDPMGGCPAGICPHKREEHRGATCTKCNACATHLLDENDPVTRADRERERAARAAAAGTAPTAPMTGDPMSTMTGASGAPSVRVESVGGFIQAVDDLHALAMQVSESGTALGLTGAAQHGLPDAVDMLRGVAQAIRTGGLQQLVEAASAIPDGAEEVTVGAARAE